MDTVEYAGKPVVEKMIAIDHTISTDIDNQNALRMR